MLSLICFENGDNLVPGGGSGFRIETGFFEDGRIPDETHGFVVGWDAVGLAVPGDRLHGAWPELSGRVANIFWSQFHQLSGGEELNAPEDRHLGHHRSRATEGSGSNLVKHVVVVEVLDIELDVRIRLAEGGPEISIDLLFEIGGGFVRADVPVGDFASVIERDNIGDFRGGVDFDRAGLALDVL